MVKIIKKSDEEESEEMLTESILLKELNHKNIVKYFDDFNDSKYFYIIMKYYEVCGLILCLFLFLFYMLHSLLKKSLLYL